MRSEPHTSTESLLTASAWLQSVLLGSIASTLAILAVAAVGLLMLSGRTPIRRGTTVVIGCFILFSAATIADGLLSSLGEPHPAIALTPPAPTYTVTEPRAPSADPYAGAAVPAQR